MEFASTEGCLGTGQRGRRARAIAHGVREGTGRWSRGSRTGSRRRGRGVGVAASVRLGRADHRAGEGRLSLRFGGAGRLCSGRYIAMLVGRASMVLESADWTVRETALLAMVPGGRIPDMPDRAFVVAEFISRRPAWGMRERVDARGWISRASQ